MTTIIIFLPIGGRLFKSFRLREVRKLLYRTMRSFKTSADCKMKVVAALILCFTTVAAAEDFKLVSGKGEPIPVISHGALVDMNQHLAPGHVTVFDFYADWCGPCRRLSPSLEEMAGSDPEVALRKIDIVNWRTAVAHQFNIYSIPQVKVYDRNGRLIGTVRGVDFEKVKSYVAQAKSSG